MDHNMSGFYIVGDSLSAPQSAMHLKIYRSSVMYVAYVKAAPPRASNADRRIEGGASTNPLHILKWPKSPLMSANVS